MPRLLYNKFRFHDAPDSGVSAPLFDPDPPSIIRFLLRISVDTHPGTFPYHARGFRRLLPNELLPFFLEKGPLKVYQEKESFHKYQ